MRLLLASVISISFAACNTGTSANGPVGRAVARITQVPPDVGCVAIVVTGAGRTVVDTFDVTPGQSATLQLGNLPVDEDAFTASAFSTACSAIAGVQPSWSTVTPFYAPIAIGSTTSLTLTLEPTGGASIGIDFGGDGGDPGFDGGINDLSPSFDNGVDGAADMAYTPADLAHP